jgi:hypothetical protein
LLTSLSLDMLFGDNNTTVPSWSECTAQPGTSGIFVHTEIVSRF